MAKLLQSTFELMLFTVQDENRLDLPSPEELKNKIILKCRKLPSSVTEACLDDPSEQFLCDTLKTGKLYLPSTSATKETWLPFLFALTHSSFMYIADDTRSSISADTMVIKLIHQCVY